MSTEEVPASVAFGNAFDDVAGDIATLLGQVSAENFAEAVRSFTGNEITGVNQKVREACTTLSESADRSRRTWRTILNSSPLLQFTSWGGIRRTRLMRKSLFVHFI